MGSSDIGTIRDFKKIDPNKIHHILNPGEVGAILEWQVQNKNGKILEHVAKKAESYNTIFMQLLWVMAAPGSYELPVSVIDTGNAARNILGGAILWKATALAGTITYGIVVGTDNTAPTVSDYALGAIILHDAAPPTAGRLQYGAVTFGAAAADATTSQFTITRNFANASGGDITIEEIGLYVQGEDTSLTTRYFMTIRDIVGGIVIPTGSTLTVNYRPQAVI